MSCRVVISSESCRSAVVGALWNHAGDMLDGPDGLNGDSVLTIRDRLALGDTDNAFFQMAGVDGFMAEFAMVREAVVKAYETMVDGAIEVPLSGAELQEGLDAVRCTVESELFWTLAPEARLRALATRDAAVELSSRMQEGVA